MSAMRTDNIDCGHISACINGVRKSTSKSELGELLHWRVANEIESAVIKTIFLLTQAERVTPKMYLEFKEGDNDADWKS